MQIVPVEAAQTQQAPAGDPRASDTLCRHLEQGDILLVREAPFVPRGDDAEFLRAQHQAVGQSHKNIAYKPNRRQVTGVEATNSADAARLRAILEAYSRGALEFLARLLPRYAASWTVDYASFRPFEEHGRDLPLSRRNDLMHVDAFPTRPTHGGRILRAFTNLHPTRDRVWVTADPFEELAARYAAAAGLPAVTGPAAGLRRQAAKLTRLVGVKAPDRSPYDEFMLRFHHFLKANEEFQQSGRRDESAFGPGDTWISFTDQIAHAVLSGQYALEQTCIVPHASMLEPDRSPLSVLERLAGQPLAAHAEAAVTSRGHEAARA